MKKLTEEEITKLSKEDTEGYMGFYVHNNEIFGQYQFEGKLKYQYIKDFDDAKFEKNN
jgi:hypothetical protein